MSQAVVAGAWRTPTGLRNGALSGWHPADLAGSVLAELSRRCGIDPVSVDEVILGCTTLVGDQGCNLARSAVLAAGWPESVPASTLDCQGASSMQAVAMAMRSVASGDADVVVAAGVELSSTTSAGTWVEPGTRPFGPAVVERYAGQGGLVPPGVAVERLIEAMGLTREALDGWAERSRRRAQRAQRQGRFDDETMTLGAKGWDRQRRVEVAGQGEVALDEALFADVGDAAVCPPLFLPGGAVTAANRAPVGDGAAAVVVVSPERAAAMDRPPLAHLVASASAGANPRDSFGAAVPATTRALARAGLALGRINRFEVDETFAAVPLAWMAELGVDADLVNPDGGAIAVGQAPGAAGARMVATLAHGLSRARSGLGLAVLAGVGGVASAVVLAGPED